MPALVAAAVAALAAHPAQVPSATAPVLVVIIAIVVGSNGATSRGCCCCRTAGGPAHSTAARACCCSWGRGGRHVLPRHFRIGIHGKLKIR